MNRCKGHETILISSSLRQMSLYLFKRFVKTTISGLWYADFSEWFTGHVDSGYKQLTENFSSKFLYESESKNLCGMPVIDAAN
jgi:hypothetical protein